MKGTQMRGRQFGAGLAMVVFGSCSTAHAQDSGQGTLDTVVVSAEKSPQTLRNIPASVIVTNSADLDRLTETYTTDALLARVSDIVVTSPGNSAPAVRGLDGTGPASGADAFFAGTRPRLNYQVDGRTLGYNDTVYLDSDLWDVRQVEVYRGAQSTLQGRNAIAGVIAIETNDPTFSWEGAGRALLGNEDERQVSAALSGPLIDDLLAFRLAGDYRQSESFVGFTGYPEDEDPGRYQTWGLRGKLLTLSLNDARAPQSDFVVQPYDHYTAALPQQPVFRDRTGTAISDTRWIISPLMSLEANLSASDYHVYRYAPVTQGNALIDGAEYVAQPFLRIHSAADVLSGFIAAYAFRTHETESIDLFGGGNFQDRTATTAGFGELTYKLTPALRLTAGARYEEEDRHRVGDDGPFAIDFNATYREFLPKAALAWDAWKDVTVGVTATRGYNGGGAGFTYAAPYVSYDYSPEHVWDYEGFVRASMLDGRLTLTGNVFYNQYSDLQLPFELSALSTVIRNAQRASTYGVELQVDCHPVSHAALFASFGALKTRVDEDADPAVQGNDLPRAPAFTADVGINVTPWHTLSASADMRYTDTYYSDAFNTARGRTSPYAIFNAQLSYELSRVRVFLAGRNLFNSHAPIDILPGATPAQDEAQLTSPRTFTLGVETRI
jgi:outer membrane receptor protein involved in Fe transport